MRVPSFRCLSLPVEILPQVELKCCTVLYNNLCTCRLLIMLFCLPCLDWYWTSFMAVVSRHGITSFSIARILFGWKFGTHLLRHWRRLLGMWIAVFNWLYCAVLEYIVFALRVALCVITEWMNEWIFGMFKKAVLHMCVIQHCSPYILHTVYRKGGFFCSYNKND